MSNIISFKPIKEVEDLKKVVKSLTDENVKIKTQNVLLNKINIMLVNENENLKKYNDIFIEKLQNGLKF